jgi:hypothetical protein
MKQSPTKEENLMLKPMLVRPPENLLKRAKHAVTDRRAIVQTVIAEALAPHLSEEGK